MTKKVLIAPRFFKDGPIQRAITTDTISDFLLDQNFLPIMAFYDTKLTHKDRALDLACKYLEGVSSLILQGGGDICPSFYNQENKHAENVTKFRDIFELALIQKAIEKGLPILGICRGMQIINIFFGGNLHQNLETDKWITHQSHNQNLELFKEEALKKAHEVYVNEDAEIFHWLEKTKLEVNSQHHQGIDQLGEGLQVAATSDDGLVEAFSKFSGQILGLQWHPELDLKDKLQVKLLQNWLKLI
jgi:putative glutamine amidotransferase